MANSKLRAFLTSGLTQNWRLPPKMAAVFCWPPFEYQKRRSGLRSCWNTEAHPWSAQAWPALNGFESGPAFAGGGGTDASLSHAKRSRVFSFHRLMTWAPFLGHLRGNFTKQSHKKANHQMHHLVGLFSNQTFLWSSMVFLPSV